MLLAWVLLEANWYWSFAWCTREFDASDPPTADDIENIDTWFLFCNSVCYIPCFARLVSTFPWFTLPLSGVLTICPGENVITRPSCCRNGDIGGWCNICTYCGDCCVCCIHLMLVGLVIMTLVGLVTIWIFWFMLVSDGFLERTVTFGIYFSLKNGPLADKLKLTGFDIW